MVMINTSVPNSILNTRNSSYGAGKLARDITKLLNNDCESDIHIKILGDTNKDLHSTGEIAIDLSKVTLYAHRAILRCRSSYFAAIFDGKKWKNSSGGVIYMRNISLTALYKIMEYIYTGDVHVQTEILLDVIIAAEKLKLEELSTACQTNIIILLEQAIWDESYNNGTEELQHPISAFITKLLIPSLILAYNYTMVEFFNQLLELTIHHLEVILASAHSHTSFIEIIPPQIFIQILASDSPRMQEYDVWKLAFKYACHKTKVLETVVETYFKLKRNNKYETELQIKNGDNSQVLLSDEQLKQFKSNLTPLLSAIRFDFLENYQYSHIVDILTYMLPFHRIIELQTLYMNSEKTQPLNLYRSNGQLVSLSTTEEAGEGANKRSKIIDEMGYWQQIKIWIFESNGLEGCHSAEDIKLNLLFRASEHEFSMKACHEHCDNKGPTILIVKSDDGHIFGGVNFASWETNEEYSGTSSNFLFALRDGLHRKTSAIFRYDEVVYEFTATHNGADKLDFGFYMGESDLRIVDKANTAKSFSYMPTSYDGIGTLADKTQFLVAEYEVFAIS